MLKKAIWLILFVPFCNVLKADYETHYYDEGYAVPQDSTEKDTSLPYPYNGNDGGLYLNTPSNFTTEVEYDPTTGMYIIYEKIGNLLARPPRYLTAQEYQNYLYEKQKAEYWKSKIRANSQNGNNNRGDDGLIPQIQVNNEVFGKIFGTNVIDIKPQGSAEVIFAGRYQKIDNPILPERNRSTFNFDFDQRIQMNVQGKIGTALQLGLNYDTEATFAFDNKMKLEYNGDEDNIIKKLEMGNVSLPTNGSLITGVQSLFGVKGQFQFGKTTVTGVFSEQRSQSQSINVQGGGTQQEFEIRVDNYEANKHYFLSQYFRDTYEENLENMPLNTSPVQITKVEVWVTNTRSTTQDVRNILAFMDLGEVDSGAYRNASASLPGYSLFPGPKPAQRGLPSNKNNNLDPATLAGQYPGIRDIAQANSILQSEQLDESIEFVELANARKLDPRQYTFHPQMGFISLNSSLNQDEILAVAFQYTAYGSTYQVGEFSNDGVTPPKSIILKMLKNSVLNVKTPVWDLMMKNVYYLGASQIDQQEFYLDVLYMNDETGVPVPFLPDGNLEQELLLRVMELDRVNVNGDQQPDGLFDFVEGVTINKRTGRIFFPVVEPFGTNLTRKLDQAATREKYVFQELYDSTRFKAQDQTRKNKYVLKGRYKSASGSEIFLNAFNIPQGSVTVTAGGTKLVENQDYTVDYSLGRVKIINDGILASGVPIRVSFENNALFGVQTKTFMGVTFDHRVSEDLNFGGSFLRMSERPITQKANIGEEPIANNIWGLNGNYQKDAPWLTRFVDAIPGIDTKAPSKITAQGEFAQLIPGSPRGIKINGDETTYLDDFENSQSEIDIKGWSNWQLATTPANQPDMFPEGNMNGDVAVNFNRAKLAWYVIDPVFHTGSSATPQNIRDNKTIISDNYQRQVLLEEVFPNISIDNSTPRNVATLDLSYYPNERGPYNLDVEGEPGISSGMLSNGQLDDPQSRWAGITRQLSINNFEEQNIEFIQFWVMDPYLSDPNHSGGDLYFNLGSVSEDLLKDDRQAFENGIDPVRDLTKMDSTVWGYVPRIQPITEYFDNDATTRPIQDVGFDGINDVEESSWSFQGSTTYLDRIINTHGQNSAAYITAQNDPSADNFNYYLGPEQDNANNDILERYKNYNGPEGNSSTETVDGFTASSSNVPDKEDANRDQTLNKTESYFQYKISMRPNDLEIGKNFVTDIQEGIATDLPDGQNRPYRWIQFKVPVFIPDETIGPIGDFRSIRFMRMFLKGFDQNVVLRFARLDLIRGEWRRYRFSLDDVQEEVPIDESDETIFAVNAVNLEENGNRKPIPYVLPPGINRQVIFGTASLIQENEQAMSLLACNLKDGDARAVFKNIQMDMRMYKRLKMFVHAEDANDGFSLNDKDLNLFIRLGSDYNQNYYEYEVPLVATPWGTGIDNPDLIWPDANSLDLPLEIFKSTKLQRDAVDFPRQVRYTVGSEGKFVTVIGYPNLSNVRTMMIGIRNPKKKRAGDLDDGLPKCAEVWVNELRLTDFDQRGGFAANARVTAQLADFADISLSGNMSTVGFGAIDQTVQERNKFEAFAYDFQSKWNLDKFFPEESGIKIPMFFSYSEDWKNPQFNPLDPDIEFDRALENLETQAEREELKKASQDYTRRRNLNFTNVRKERRGSSKKKPQFYDIENFSVSYAFSEQVRRDINIVKNNRSDHKGTLNYNYQNRPKNVQPFKGVKSKYLIWVRDFNFYYAPRKFTFRTDLTRINGVMQMRNTNNRDFPLPETFNKSFTWDRIYDFGYDLSKSIKIDYNARMETRIDEPANGDDNSAIIWNNFKSFGRPTKYHQTASVNWQIPINKLPYLDFVTSSLRYTGNYDWQTNSLLALDPEQSDIYFGNTIQNNAGVQLNGSLNMITLYNNVPYLKRVNQGKRPGARKGPARPKSRLEGSENREEEEGEEEEKKKKKEGNKVVDAAVRFLMMVRSVSVSYTTDEGSALPGYILEPVVLGLNPQSSNAPGLGFVLGGQTDISTNAARNGWLTPNPNQPNRFLQTRTENLNIRGTVEPFKDFRIDVTMTKVYGVNRSSLYRQDENYDPNDPLYNEGEYTNGYREYNPMIQGNYSISFWSFGSAFESSKAPNYDSKVYEQFRMNREVISRRLADQYEISDENESGWYSKEFLDTAEINRGYLGFSYISQDVMIPAFLSAYGGYDVEKVRLDARPTFPMPNWRLNYSGLMKMDYFRKKFNQFTVSHSYRSLYTISTFQTNLVLQQAQQDEPLAPEEWINENGDFLPELQIGQVSMAENFSPLIGFNMRMKNNTSIKIEFNRNRMVAMSLANNIITDTKGSEIVIGAGYIIRDVKFNLIRQGASKKAVVSNLELKGDISIRDNQTVMRRVLEEITQVTAGQRIVKITFSADYQLSRRVSTRIFYDQVISTFKTSNAFPTNNIYTGLSFRLNLAP